MPGAPTPIDITLAGSKGRNLDKTVSEAALDFSLNTVVTEAIDSAVNNPNDQQTSGVIQVGTFGSAGLNLTFDAGSLAKVRGVDVDFAGATVALPNGATRFVYLDLSGTVVASATAPAIGSGELPLWQVTTAGGVVTVSTDLRFFIRQGDRKPAFTVRASGSASNIHAEGNFESLEAALLYIDTFSTTAETLKFTILIRSTVTIAATISIPRDSISFVGEGLDSALVTGALLAPMIDLNGKTRISFDGIRFVADDAGSTAILDSVGGSHDCLVTRCWFVNGASSWDNGIVIDPGVPASSDRFTVEKCRFQCNNYGVYFARPNHNRIIDCVVEDASGAGAVGIGLGALAVASDVSQGFSVIRGCHVTGFNTGYLLKGFSLKLIESYAQDGLDTGIVLDSGGDCHVISTDVTLGTVSSVYGIKVGVTDAKVASCTFTNPRTVYTVEVPTGALVTGANVTITDTNIVGFFNTTGDLGAGIDLSATADRCAVLGGRIEACRAALQTNAGTLGTRVEGTYVKDCANGMFLNGTNSVVSNCNFLLDSTLGLDGITIDGTGHIVSNCRITNPRAIWGVTDAPIGILILSDTVTISSTYLTGFNNSANSLGAGVYFDTGSSQVSVNACDIENCYQGIQVPDTFGVTNVTIDGCRFSNITANGITVEDAQFVKISNNRFEQNGTFAAIFIGTTTDFDIIGNYIDGNGGVTDNGIYVIGDDSAGNRCTRFVIANNNMKECGSYGIQLSGFVQSGSVTGNEVDCYLPADTNNPTAVACIMLTSTGATDTINWVTVSGNTCQRAWHGIRLIGVDSTNYVENVAIDSNVIHHCGHAIGAVTADFSDASTGISVYFGRSIAISGNHVSRIGKIITDAGVEQSPSTGGLVIRSEGIKTRNCTRLAISGNIVHDMYAATDISLGISIENRSAGLGLFQSQNIAVDGNTIYSSSSGGFTLSLGAFISTGQSAVSAPAGPTELMDLIFTNNTIRRVAFEGIYLAAAQGGIFKNAVISGNTVQNLTGGFAVGIYIQTSPLDGALNAGIIDSVRIDGNSIFDSNVYGMNILAAAGATVSNVSIDGNRIGVVNSTAVYLEADTTSLLYSISATNNDIDGAGGRGIEFYGKTSAGVPPAHFGNFKVIGNNISGTGLESIRVRSEDFNLSNVTLSGNNIVGDSNTSSYAVGISLEANSPNAESVTASQITINNNIYQGDGSVDGVVLAVEGALDRLIMLGNNINIDAGTTGHALNISTTPLAPISVGIFSGNWDINGNSFYGGYGVTVSLDNGPKLWNVSFSNNFVQKTGSYGIHIQAYNCFSNPLAGSANNIAVLGNTFENATSGASEAVSLWWGDATLIDPVYDVSILNNRIQFCNNTNANPSRAIHTTYNCFTDGLLVTGNTLTSNGNNGSAASEGIIDIEMGQAAGTICSRNITISGNILSNNIGGFGIYVHANVTAAAAKLRQVKVCDNQIIGARPTALTSSADAIRLDFSGFTTDSATRYTGDVIISGNTIERIDNSTLAHSDLGIHVIGPTAAPLNDITIRGNTLRGVAAGGGGVGAIVVVSSDIVNVVGITDNIVRASSATTAGVYFQVDGTATNITVSRNTVDSIAAGDGIYIHATGADATSYLANLTVSDNTVENSPGRGIYIFGDNSTDDPDLLHAVVANNVINTPASYGIDIDFGPGAGTNQILGLGVTGNVIFTPGNTGIRVQTAAGILQQVTVSGNTVNSSAGYGIALATVGGDMFNVNASNNNLLTLDKGGIVIQPLGGNLGSLVVSGNIIKDYSGNVAATYYGGIGILTAVAIQNVTVANNSIRETSTYAIGYWFNCSGAVRAVTMTGNETHHENAANTESMRWDTGGSADQKGLTFTGNSFFASRIGISRNASSFAPSYSTIVGNTERIYDGAVENTGTWTTFYGFFTNSTDGSGALSTNQN